MFRNKQQKRALNGKTNSSPSFRNVAIMLLAHFHSTCARFSRRWPEDCATIDLNNKLKTNKKYPCIAHTPDRFSLFSSPPLAISRNDRCRLKHSRSTRLDLISIKYNFFRLLFSFSSSEIRKVFQRALSTDSQRSNSADFKMHLQIPIQNEMPCTQKWKSKYPITTFLMQ